jgi:hypothetical protein
MVTDANGQPYGATIVRYDDSDVKSPKIQVRPVKPDSNSTSARAAARINVSFETDELASGTRKDYDLPFEVMDVADITLVDIDDRDARYLFGDQVHKQFYVRGIRMRNRLDEAESDKLRGKTITIRATSLEAQVVLEDQKGKNESFKLSTDSGSGVPGEKEGLVTMISTPIFSLTAPARAQVEPVKNAFFGWDMFLALAGMLNATSPEEGWNPFRAAASIANLSKLSTAFVKPVQQRFEEVRDSRGKGGDALVMPEAVVLKPGEEQIRYVFIPKHAFTGSEAKPQKIIKVLPNQKLKLPILIGQ